MVFRGKPGGISLAIGTSKMRAQRTRSLPTYSPLSYSSNQAGGSSKRDQERTFDVNRRRIAARSHDAAQEHRHKADIALFENWRCLAGPPVS